MARVKPTIRGAEVRAIRKRLGLDINNFAAVCGVARQTIYAWENELTGISGPSYHLLQMFARMESPARLEIPE